MGQLRGRTAVAVVLAMVAVSVGGLAGRYTDGAPAGTPPIVATTGEPGPEKTTVQVHVSGMVVSPGVVDVAPDAIVAEAIEAAGGLRSEAVVDQINLAAPVTAGDQIVVPGPDGPASGEGDVGDGNLSLNRATAGELETLPGVGPVLAERIVSFRDDNGGYDAVEDLLEVPGIGEAKLAAIRDLVRP